MHLPSSLVCSRYVCVRLFVDRRLHMEFICRCVRVYRRINRWNDWNRTRGCIIRIIRGYTSLEL